MIAVVPIAQVARVPGCGSGGGGCKSRWVPSHGVRSSGVRTSDCGSEGRGFEARRTPKISKAGYLLL